LQDLVALEYPDELFAKELQNSSEVAILETEIVNYFLLFSQRAAMYVPNYRAV